MCTKTMTTLPGSAREIPPSNSTQMPNTMNIASTNGHLNSSTIQSKAEKPHKLQVVWRNVAIFVFLHVGALMGLYYVVFEAMWYTIAFNFDHRSDSAHRSSSVRMCTKTMTTLPGSAREIPPSNSTQMPNTMNIASTNGHLNSSTIQSKAEKPHKLQVVRRNVAIFVFLHVGALMGLYYVVFEAMWYTIAFTWLCCMMGGLGITAGAHRLWAHKSYKADAPLRAILMMFQTMALQNDVIEWSRDHRGHHKWSDTNADPHNSNRGFFFSHMGWLLVKKHPEVIEKGKTLDMSDLTNDPILAFQRRYYKPLCILVCIIFPTVIPWYFWNESFNVSYCTTLLRYCYTLHCTWMVNSVAHRFGNRPFDKHIEPRQSIVTAFAALGEGWHNYHHAFPYDYKTAELPYSINFTTMFIDFFAMVGWVHDRKSVSAEMVAQKVARSGDGSYAEEHAKYA